MNVGQRLKILREMKGLTVNKLANNAGLSQSFLRDIELGNKNPTVETLTLFCEALDISLSDFFSEENTEINPFLISAIKKLSTSQQQTLSEFINCLTDKD